MNETAVQWRHGRVVRFSVAEDVPDSNGVISAASYALLFARDDEQLAAVLRAELAPRGLSVEVLAGPGRTTDPLTPEILVAITPTPTRAGLWLERRARRWASPE